MKSNQIFCDRCGVKLDEMNVFVDVEIEMNHKWKTMDLCKKCFDEMWDMIDGFCLSEKNTQ